MLGPVGLTKCNAAGTDATEAFYSLHRQEILHKPQYSRLAIGVVEGSTNKSSASDFDLSEVPYAEPTWLREGYCSPYYTEASAE